ncbi:hypothetical protein SAMN04515674_101480 [Pseudarcicella hirudinis]|uniref:Uncharacterized protein n=1 Tax=Pseudarcicella hirudinis TaxID=1079859 RepID=A0A1I5MWI3_9BACT|nr:hypothetical protein [Pseudarcicella hirudinis]SFP13870.1 hypothetical protein SAMN04515674_101480 [Pseudarcicella hirudinis]
MSKVTIGRIVIYKPTEEDISLMQHSGFSKKELPAIITAVHSDDCVNLKVFLDGHGDLWKLSRNRGTHWDFPTIEKT